MTTSEVFLLLVQKKKWDIILRETAWRVQNRLDTNYIRVEEQVSESIFGAATEHASV